MVTHFLNILKQRGRVAQVSHEEELNELLNKGVQSNDGIPYGVYAGFDPTAKSLHVGHLAALILLRRAQDCGLTPIIVFGGATGLIGDPTDRSDMRPMNSKELIAEYVENFKKLTTQYFRTDVPNKPIFLNNIDWIGNIPWIDFLRDTGVHFTVARLLAADVNRTRFEQGGLTFMELGYQLLQAYDFLHLSRKYNCFIQLGGDDQWSNILAGADLIRRVDRKKAFALTQPLLADSSGRKIGKTSGNALWIDATLTPPFEFYQYFRNVGDASVADFLRTYTNLEEPEIVRMCDMTFSNINETKEYLAFSVTELVHGKAAAEGAQQAAKALFAGGGDLSSAPSTLVQKSEVESGLNILDILVKCELSQSKGEARKLIQGNGLSLNGEKLTDAHYQISLKDFETEQNAIVLKKGKKDFHLIKLSH